VSSLPTWATWSIVAAAVLSPVLAFLTAIVVEILFGLVKDAGVPALLILVTACALAWFLHRLRSLRPTGTARART